jgi:PIN like domain
MKFFFDRNISPLLARMVEILDRDHTVRAYDDDDRFTPMMPDVEWIKILAADDSSWVIVSGDGRILKNKTELSALKEAKLTFFCLSNQWMHMNIYKEQAWKFIKVWPDIVENAKGASQRIFEVSGGAGLKVERKHI